MVVFIDSKTRIVISPKVPSYLTKNMTKCSKYGGDYFVSEVDPTYVGPIKNVLAKPTEFKLSIYIRVRDK